MSRLSFLLLLAVTATISPCASAAESREEPSSRIVILAISSSESFSSGLPVLRYPELDRQRFVDAMTSMAGVPDQQVVVVKEGTVGAVRLGFQKVASIVSALNPSQEKSKFVFYYSGHSDPSGLHFSDGKLEKNEFHKLIAEVKADTKVALLDSCYSGALAAKGVKAAKIFTMPKGQFDEPSGAVFLTATSASEQAFELDEIKGSLFTHHVTGGLYGQADLNQDGLVTIEELYQYVYKKVDNDTMGLPAVLRQEPEYSSRLSGRGALVMSFVKMKTSEVLLDPALSGEITLSAKRGVQTFRVFKSADEVKSLRLIPGIYDVTVRNGDQHGQMELTVVADRTSTVAKEKISFRTVPNMKLVAKGNRAERLWGVAIASHVGSMWKVAPHLEGSMTTAGIRLPVGTWRLSTILGLHQSEVEYDRPGKRTQHGESSTASLILGGSADFEIYELINGVSVVSMFGFGSDYTTYKWDDGQQVDRSFESIMPKVVAGIGSAYLLRSGRSFDLSFRREWLFGTEKSTGDVLSFSASLFMASYRF